MAVLVSVLFLIILKKTEGQITSNLQDEIKCAGDSVNLNWAYTTNNQIVATWLFGTTTIMSSVAGGTPVVESAYTGRAAHGGNGVLTLTGLTTADSGTYSLGVTYSAAPTSVNDQVEVTVYDKITEASTPQCGTDTVTCGSALMSGVSYSWKVGNAVVSHASWSIPSSGTNTYECTISGNRVTNCLDAGVSTTQSTNCTFKESKELTDGEIAAIVFGCLFSVAGIVAAVVLGLKKKYPCQKGLGSKKKKRDSGNSGTPRTESGNATNQGNETKDPLPKTDDRPRHQELQPITNATNLSVEDGKTDLNTKQKLSDIPSKKSS